MGQVQYYKGGEWLGVQFFCPIASAFPGGGPTASGRKEDLELWKSKVRNTVARLARAHPTLQSGPPEARSPFPDFSFLPGAVEEYLILAETQGYE